MMNNLRKSETSGKAMNSPSDIKSKQKRNLIVGVGIVIALGFWIFSVLNDDSSSTQKSDKTQTTNFDTPLKNLDNQSALMSRTQNMIQAQQKTSSGIQQQLDLMKQSKDSEDKFVQQQTQTIKQLQSEMDDIKKQVSSRQTGAGNGFLPSGGAGQINDGIISDDSLQLTPRKTLYDIPAKNPATFVPAGTFVSALTLGGADASAGVTSQSDPMPMLFRIMGEGTLPNHAHSHLKGCVATAASIGDISSERGMIRIERLSCTKDDGQIIEMPGEATIFGPDGKDGVRGTPLWREGPLLERAFMSGALSGLSNGIASGYTTSQVTPLGGTVQSVNNGKIMQYGLATGVGNAAEKLADYNIKLADQYHPVIQLSAGTVVDIVFLKGFYLDGKKHDPNNDNNQDAQVFAKDNQTSNQNTQSQINMLNSPSPQMARNAQPLPLTPQQIEALKQKNSKQGYF
jgi:conjugal transfer pilus assembly protein TraB